MPLKECTKLRSLQHWLYVAMKSLVAQATANWNMAKTLLPEKESKSSRFN